MNNIHVLKLSEYSRPEITESKREAWVEYGGSDNNYYQYLIDRYYKFYYEQRYYK
jgi:hypothetical protein